MVRLKTRYILFEILHPQNLATIPTVPDPKDQHDNNNNNSDQRHNTTPSPLDLDPKVATALSLRHSIDSIETYSLLKLIREAVEQNFGVQGAGSVKDNLILKYFSPRTHVGILRVSRPYVRKAWASLSLINKINDRPVIIKVLRVSGTIQKSEKAAIQRDKYMIQMVYSNNESQVDSEKKKLDLLLKSVVTDDQDVLDIEDDDKED